MRGQAWNLVIPLQAWIFALDNEENLRPLVNDPGWSLKS